MKYPMFMLSFSLAISALFWGACQKSSTEDQPTVATPVATSSQEVVEVEKPAINTVEEPVEQKTFIPAVVEVVEKPVEPVVPEPVVPVIEPIELKPLSPKRNSVLGPKSLDSKPSIVEKLQVDTSLISDQLEDGPVALSYLVYVDVGGNVTDIEVSGNSRLRGTIEQESLVVRALQKAKFSIGMKDGVPVPYRLWHKVVLN